MNGQRPEGNSAFMFVVVENGRLCTAWQDKHIYLLEGIWSDLAFQMPLGLEHPFLLTPLNPV